MNIFGIGGPELVLILVIMLIVAGPKRMVQWSYVVGQWMAKLRRLWEETVTVVQRELNEANIDVELPKTPPTRANMRQSAKKLGESLLDTMGSPQDELQRIQAEMRSTAQDVDTHMRIVNERNDPPTDEDTDTPPSDDESETIESYGTWGGGSQ